MHQRFFTMRGYGAISVITSFLLILLSCGGNSQLQEGIVAQVNDQSLSLEQLQFSVPEGINGELALGLKKDIITRWVDNEALYQAALREGVDLTEKDNFLLKKYEKSLLVQRFLNEKLSLNYQISQKENETYYQQHRNEFIRQIDEIHVVHLFLEQRDAAIFEEINRADNLLDIIQKYYLGDKSTDGQPNGDLGYIPMKSLPDQYAAALKKMKTGSISSPIRSAHGYHFFQLLDWQRAGSVRDLELVKNEISIRLRQERRVQEQERLLKQVRGQAKIQTYLSKIQ